MKPFLRTLRLLLLCVLTTAPATFLRAESAAQLVLPAAPASLEVTADQTLALTLTAKGVQIYVCQPTPGPTPHYVWTFKGPEADLFDATGQKVGRHFAGPTWELTDGGGKVVGKLKTQADSPDGKGIPWLLLEAMQATGPTLGQVRSIRRIATVGGKPPTEPADKTNAGQERRVDYTATYQFYVVKP